MLRIAYFSPLPPDRSGIADYSLDLLPHISKEAEITFFVQNIQAISTELQTQFPIYPLGEFPQRRWNYDLALYQMGNSLFHKKMYTMLRRYPGFTVLHDYILHHFIASITAGEDDFPAYLRELAYAKGIEGVRRAYAIQRGKSPTPLFDWPMNERVIDLSVGVIVHSDYVRLRLLAKHPQAHIRRVNQPVPLPSLRDQGSVRRNLQLPEDAFLIVSGGQITPEKRLDLVLQAFARFHHNHPNTLWLVVGESLEDDAGWLEQIQLLGLGDVVLNVGYVGKLDTFYDYIAAGDVCINLRYPTSGETSASALRAMAMGRPVIVSDLGWYTELPDDCCAKISHDGREAEQIDMILTQWFEQPNARRAVGRQARHYIARECDPARVAQSYVAFIQEILNDKE